MKLETQAILENMDRKLSDHFMVTRHDVTAQQLHSALSRVIMAHILPRWRTCNEQKQNVRRAYYFSAEYLMGRLVYNNLLALGLLEPLREDLAKKGIDFNIFEEIEDTALGNGGLGRLAACFLDSAATMDLPLDGYGLRYKFGLFRQRFADGFQAEEADDWLRDGDPWERRMPADTVEVEFASEKVLAIPYDMPVIGYQSDTVSTLRLFQAQAIHEFDFRLFNEQQYDAAVHAKNTVENITRCLYPNDSTDEGKRLRLKQQYFLSSASLQDILNRHRRAHGGLDGLKETVCIQLNDTHPVVSIPELIRLLMKEGYDFNAAYDVACQVFSYTNHTVMVEALEKWSVPLFKSVIPQIFDIILQINTRFCGELLQQGFQNIHEVSIIQGDDIHMANLATCCSRTINGVARLHSQILKDEVFKHFYTLYPERFQNKTNGITPRRWLLLCNPELSRFITERIGSEWPKNLHKLQELKEHMDDADIAAFNAVKHKKKEQLSAYILKKEGVLVPPHFLFDVQVKRMHEYKRQLMNAFAVLDIYYGLKEGRIWNYTPTAYIFGAKAAPGYYRAKAAIKFINDIAALVNSDPMMQDQMKVVFVQNYNCSYAEIIIPAADISEQISPAGTEASGTGNMKLMLNGAVTLGTFDGANVEIVEEAGTQNNFIFGRSVNELKSLRKTYRPQEIYHDEPRVRRVVDTLIDGTFPRQAVYDELHASLLTGGGYGAPDQYYVLLELMPYIERRLEANFAYRNRMEFGRKCLMNTANAGKFSSDRTIADYARDIWRIETMHVK